MLDNLVVLVIASHQFRFSFEAEVPTGTTDAKLPICVPYSTPNDLLNLAKFFNSTLSPTVFEISKAI